MGNDWYLLLKIMSYHLFINVLIIYNVYWIVLIKHLVIFDGLTLEHLQDSLALNSIMTSLLRDNAKKTALKENPDSWRDILNEQDKRRKKIEFISLLIFIIIRITYVLMWLAIFYEYHNLVLILMFIVIILRLWWLYRSWVSNKKTISDDNSVLCKSILLLRFKKKKEKEKFF